MSKTVKTKPKKDEPKSLSHWREPEQLKRITKWAEQGLSMDDIANNIGITGRTLYNWRDKDRSIFHALTKGQDTAVEILENALFKRAIGYDIEEVTYRFDEEGNKIPQRSQTKHIYPDVTALKFALINKSSGKWTDRVEYNDQSAHDKLDKMLEKMKDSALDVD